MKDSPIFRTNKSCLVNIVDTNIVKRINDISFLRTKRQIVGDSISDLINFFHSLEQQNNREKSNKITYRKSQ